jgi:lipopolysaccharide export system permease protein
MKLYRYIASAISLGTLMVLGVALILLFFINFLSETNSIGNGSYSFLNALAYVALTLPLGLYNIFPIVILIGVLIGLGGLASTNELTVMRASGMSLIKIASCIVSVAIFMTVIAVGIGEGMAPQLAMHASSEKFVEQSGGQAINTLHGVWLRNGDVFYHIETVESSTELQGVTRFEFNSDHMLVTESYAQNGNYQNKQWSFNNINVTHLNFEHITATVLPQATWDLNFNIKLLNPNNSAYMTLQQLHEEIDYQNQSHLNSSTNELTFWNRLFQPLSILVMVLIGIPFIFGPLRTVSMGLRLLSGIMVGLLFYLGDLFLGPFSIVYQISPIIAALLSPIIFFFFAIFLFWRKG